MEPIDQQELNDGELDALLREWKTPAVPVTLRARAGARERAAWWRRMWTESIRIPLPLAACLAVALVVSAWRWVTPPPPRILIRTERVEVPVVKEQIVTKMIYTEPPSPSTIANSPRLQPVSELRPRIIRAKEQK